MKGFNKIMAQNDYVLESLKNEIDAAQGEIDSAKSRLDILGERRSSLKNQIDSVKYRIEDIKHSIDEEYRMMKICYEARDRIDAENHRYNAQSYKDSLQYQYEIKNGYYDELNQIKGDFETALSSLRTAKERKQHAREAFNTRLEMVRNQKEKENAKWKEKSCKLCGTIIRYNIEWNHVPDLCKTCQEKEKSKWHETVCKKCGKTIRYHQDWVNIPTLCKECKANFRHW